MEERWHLGRHRAGGGDINTIAVDQGRNSLLIGTTLYFNETDPDHGTELWKTDGTSAGTVLVRDINPGANSSIPSNLTNVNGTLYFSATDGTNGTELWKSDGTSAGTVLVRDINPGPNGSIPSNLTNINGTLYFSATDGTNGTELWKSDGTSAGTVLVRDIFTGSGSSSSPSNLTNITGTLYFSAADITNGRELWKSDGTSAGTVLVRDINSGGSSSPSNLTNVNGALYFSASDGTNGTELWKSDGTSAGTVLVRDINPGPGSSSPFNLTNINGTLYFSATDSSNGTELWKSDGTSAGTVLVRDINPGSGSSNPSILININGTLYFSATDGSTGIELWKTDGTSAGTVLVRDINSGSGISSPSNLTNINGTLYFSANDGTNGQELWKSDGTSAGTVLVRDINSGSGFSSPANLTNINGTLYFTAFDPVHGRDWWTTDGTAAGTVRVTSLPHQTNDSGPTSLTPMANVAPGIADATAGQAVNDNSTVAPFITVTIGDIDSPAQTEKVTVTLDNAAKGVFTPASLSTSGFVSIGGGAYTFSGTAAQATTAIRALVFDPADNRVAPGSTETTSLTLQVLNAFAGNGTSSGTPGISAKGLQAAGTVSSGSYWIDPDGWGGNSPVQAYADLTTNSGGWTLVARSTPGSPLSDFTPNVNTGPSFSPSGGTGRIDFTGIGLDSTDQVMIVATGVSTVTTTYGSAALATALQYKNEGRTVELYIRESATPNYDATATDTTTSVVSTSINDAPIAAFTASPNPAAPTQTLSFNAGSSSDPDPADSIVSYAWDFGDGSNATGSTITHSYSAFGTYTATLTVTDNHGLASTPVSHSIAISQGNHAPVAQAGGPYLVQSGNSVTLNASGSTDADAAFGNSIVSYAWDLDNNGTYGDVTGSTPSLSAAQIAALFSPGTDHTVSVRVTDTFGATGTASTTLYVNRPPNAVTDTISTAEDTAVSNFSATLLSNDSDPDSNPLTITQVGSAQNGSVQLNGGNPIFTPAANFNGQGSFTYTVGDGKGGTATASVTVNISAVNDPPALTNAGPTASSTEQVFAVLDSDLTVSDVDLDARSSFGSAGDYGNAGSTLASLTIARHGGANAQDTFGFDTSATSFKVTNGNHLGFTPSLVYFATFTSSNGTLTINFTSSTTTATTALVNEVIQHITYANASDDPPPSVTLDYTFNDGSPAGGQGTGASATASGSVTVNIAAVNDAPVAVADTLAATEDTPVTFTAAQLLGNDTDVDNPNSALSIASVTSGSGGTAVLNPDGTVSFTPNANFNGAASFTYTVTDGTTASAPATVTVNVAAVNDAPTIISNGGGDTAAVSIAENATAVTTVSATDPDVGQTLSYAISGGADAARFAINQTTGALSFVTAPNFEAPTDAGSNNVYDVTVQASDGNGGADTQAITVSVMDVDEVAPTVTSFTASEPTLTNASTVHYTVTFSESVTGVDASDFTLTTTGASGASLASVTADSGSNGTQYTVSVSTGSGNGTIALNLQGAATIQDLAGNGLAGGTFQAQTSYATGAGPYFVAIGDVNGDGKPDLVAANSGSNTVSVLLGNGNGTFQTQTTYGDRINPACCRDRGRERGRQAGPCSGQYRFRARVSVLLGNGNGTFQGQTTYATNGSPESVAIGDVNGDGKPDLAFANTGYGHSFGSPRQRQRHIPAPGHLRDGHPPILGGDRGREWGRQAGPRRRQ